MLSPTSTPRGLASERRRFSGRCWRVVEAQHRVSTMKLVDTLAEHEVLETAIEASKPTIPAECRHLHYLLVTPFRYRPAYPRGSRFRRAGFTPGVFYASRSITTAVAEMAFHRLLFFAESPQTPWPANPGEFTTFAADIRTRSALDLTRPPFAARRAQWIDCTDYEPCQTLVEEARAAAIDVIRYESARDPEGGLNLAVLACGAFASAEPVAQQTWRLHFGSAGVRAVCAFPDQRMEFTRDAFARDSRIATLSWAR
jgi:RES domain-containing protein